MANADSVSEDWAFFAIRMNHRSGTNKAALVVHMVSPELRLAHEFHIVGTMSGDKSIVSVNYNFLMAGEGTFFKSTSLRSVRGLTGFVDSDPDEGLSFKAFTRSGQYYIKCNSSIGAPGTDLSYGINGVWMLHNTLNYADMFGKMPF